MIRSDIVLFMVVSVSYYSIISPSCWISIILVTVLSEVLNVTVPVLEPTFSFVAPIPTVPFPVPLVVESVIQDADFVTVHEVFEVTVTSLGGAIGPKYIA